jgi:hypothetical protein
MVKRRKFLIGAGSLIAGGAAATGTGAFTTMESGDRTTEVTVASDAESYIGLKGTSRYANGDSQEGGKLALDFTGDVTFSYNGDGVNPDSTYRFDDVFSIINAIAGRNEDYGDGQNDDNDQLLGKPVVYIETEGFDVDIEFYVSGTDSRPVPYGTSITGEQNEIRMNDPDSFDIGVKIEGTSSAKAMAGGTITVHATIDGEQDRFPMN